MWYILFLLSALSNVNFYAIDMANPYRMEQVCIDSIPPHTSAQCVFIEANRPQPGVPKP